jgi:endonuclease VIII
MAMTLATLRLVPEGDSIARLAIRLRAELPGRTVVWSRFMTARTALVDLAGRSLDEISSVGKHLLLRFSGGVTLHVHLGMDGSLQVRPGGVRPAAARRVESSYRHTVRFVIGFEATDLVGDDVSVVEIVPTDQEERVVGHLGPDLCGPAWDDRSVEGAVARLGSGPDRPVIEALLDQRNLAGVGNVWAVESCFLLGLYPWTPITDVGDLRRMVRLERRLLLSGIRTPGHVTTGDRRPRFAHWVYRRSNEPCRRCGVPIATRLSGRGAQRTTWWCPSCQPSRVAEASAGPPGRSTHEP